MKVSTLDIDTIRHNKNYGIFSKLNTFTAQNSIGNEASTPLDSYEAKKAYYHKKLEADGYLFDDEKSFLDAIAKPKDRAPLFDFFREQASEELLYLSNKTNLTGAEKDRIEGLKEIIKAFPNQKASLSEQNKLGISFGGSITQEQRQKCHLAIHSASAACAGISVALGEGAAVGMDTAFLRGTQALMFLYLQNLLDVELPASLLYIGRQYVMGEYLGVRGAQVLIGWLGLGGHAASGGTASGPVAGTVRGVNSALSAGITEKMGWGYVNSYERDNMNTKTQLINSAFYVAAMEIMDIKDFKILDSSKYSDIKTALDNIPKEDLSMLGQAMHTLTNAINVPRTGSMFTLKLVQGILESNKLDAKDTKEYFKNLINTALLGTVLYEIVNIPGDSVVRDDALMTLKKVEEEFKSTPEVFQEFQKLQKEVFDKLNFENLNTREFIKQFKDKKFIYNLALATGESTSILAEKWRKRNVETLKNAHAQANKNGQSIMAKGATIDKNLTPEDKKNLTKDITVLLGNFKNDMNNRTRGNHGLSQIAGYDGTKALLTLTYLDAVNHKNEDMVPNIMLFYGPSGTGKTLSGRAIAEDAGARFKTKKLGDRNEEKILNWIRKTLDEAEGEYHERKRYTIIQFNEFDNLFKNTPALKKEFLDLVKDSAKKYHTTFFLTTNNPMHIDKSILNKIDLKIAMRTANREDIHEIVKHYLNGKEINGYNQEEIVDAFQRLKPNAMYSNSQIAEIICNLPTLCTQEDFVNIIKSINPIITQKINQKFLREQELLGKETE